MELIELLGLFPGGVTGLVIVTTVIIVYGACNLLGNLLFRLYGLGVPAWLIALSSAAIAFGIVQWFHSKPSLTGLGDLTRAKDKTGRCR